MSKEDLNSNDLNDVAGGNSTLEKYLSKLGSKDKNRTLVDCGQDMHLRIENEINFDDDNVYVAKRERSSPDIDSE